MDFIWECMVVSFKAGIGTILWALAICIFTIVFGLLIRGIVALIQYTIPERKLHK